MASLLAVLLGVNETEFHNDPILWPPERRRILMSALYDALSRDESIQLKLVELLTNYQKVLEASRDAQNTTKTAQEQDVAKYVAQEAGNIVQTSLHELYEELSEKMKQDMARVR